MFHVLDRILRPDPQWMEDVAGRKVIGLLLVIVFGSGLYGYTVGVWKAPEMGWYVAVKMPLLILLTLGCNALLNGILGMLLHGSLSFRQSLMALLWSSATAAVLLASLSPVTLGLAWNAPDAKAANIDTAHAGYLLTHTLLIAAVGIFSNVHLYRLLHGTGNKGSTATLIAWLLGNGLLGSQFSWIMRPFFGSPGLKVEFLRENALEGKFHESVWRSLLRVSRGFEWEAIFLLLAAVVMAWIVITGAKKKSQQK
jgi:hypothetical protein